MLKMKLDQRILVILFLLAFFQGIRLGVEAWAPHSLVCNPGGAFGAPLPLFLVVLLGVLALGFLGVQWWRVPDTISQWFWPLLIGAGASNLGERLIFGCVTDYFHFVFSFNLADAGLTVGCLGLLFSWGRKIS